MATQKELLNAAGEARWQSHEILENPELSIDQKIRQLESLELDLRQLQQATEENMPPGVPTEGGDVAERLRRVNLVLDLLRH